MDENSTINNRRVYLEEELHRYRLERTQLEESIFKLEFELAELEGETPGAPRSFARISPPTFAAEEVLNTIGQGIIITNDTSHIEYINPFYASLLGYQPEELLGKTIQHIIFPEDIPTLVKVREERLQGLSSSYEMLVRRKDGKSLYVNVTGAPRYEYGHVTGTIAVVTNLTERYQMEEELRQSRLLYQTLVHNLPNSSILVFDHSLRYILADGAGLERIGLSREQLEGKTLWEVLPPGQVSYFEPFYRLTLQGEATTTECLVRGRYYLAHTVPMRDSQGQVIAGMILSQDITDLKEAQKSLVTQKERLMITLESIGEAVVTTDSDGRIVLFNTFAERLSGYSREEAIGKEYSQVLVIESVGEDGKVSRETGLINSARLQDSASSRIMELAGNTFLTARNGEKRRVSGKISFFHSAHDGGLTGMVLALQDITEKVRLEAESLRAQKLESLGMLAGGIAHDFNNILTGIVGNMALVRKEIEATSLTHTQELLGEAEKAAWRAQKLANQLITFARGGTPLRETLLLRGLLEEITHLAASSTNLTLRFEVAGDLWPVNIDRAQFEQVVHNLVVNASHAQPGGGELEIAAENVEPGTLEAAVLLNRAGAYVKIHFRNKGVEIAPRVMEHIFDPYFTATGNGNGLELATVFSIVRRHEGYITVSSEVGRGTTFTIYLPAILPNTGTPSTGRKNYAGVLTSRPGPGVKRRILVMDDEPAIRRVLEKSLSMAGYEVVLSEEGSQAIELYQKSLKTGQPFDLLIMDLTVPAGMGGKEALGELLKINPEVKAIVVSGYSEDAVMANYHDYGFINKLSKPFRLEELRQKIAEILDEPL